MGLMGFREDAIDKGSDARLAADSDKHLRRAATAPGAKITVMLCRPVCCSQPLLKTERKTLFDSKSELRQPNASQNLKLKEAIPRTGKIDEFCVLIFFRPKNLQPMVAEEI